jgi:hypothetical protein
MNYPLFILLGTHQDVKIECNLKEKDKIVKVKYLYNKQRIIKKIIHKITKED